MSARAPALLATIAGVVLGVACGFAVNPDHGHFSCATDKDCGKGYACHVQVPTGNGLCFQDGECTAEVCDGQDNDCNGVVDDGFDLSTDNANCGACGNVCNAGTHCVGGSCLELNETECSDGQDNDGDGLTDCADPDCDAQPCDAADAGSTCQRVSSDAGAQADASACLGHETECGDGLDDDGDGLPDCLDPDCLCRSCGGTNTCGPDGTCGVNVCLP